jgi:hypothetical protein
MRQPDMGKCQRFFCCISIGIGTFFLIVSQPASAQQPGEYKIVKGAVDEGTYVGWKLFHSTCYGCHGVDALGTDLAPNLLGRVQKMTPRAFVSKVLTSYRIVLPDTDTNSPDSTSAVGSQELTIEDILRRDRQSRVRIVMPAWENDPNINPHVLDLFAYLTARADGKLAPGRPKRTKRQRSNSASR